MTRLKIRFILYYLLFILGRLFGLRSNQVLVLCYHSIAADSWRFSVSPSVFREQIEYLTHFFTPISVDYLRLYLEGRVEIKEPSFILSFDDGYADIYGFKDYLKEKGIYPAVFLLASPVLADREQLQTKRGFLSLQQIRDLADSGWTIGCHSSTHADFLTLDSQGAEKEIIDAKHKLEKILGVKVFCFAYPKGRYTKEIVKTVGSVYALGFSMDSGFVSRKSNVLTLPRIGVDRTHTFLEFKALFSPVTIVFKKLFSRVLYPLWRMQDQSGQYLDLKPKPFFLKEKLFTLSFVVFCALILLFTLRALPGNPQSWELNDQKWTENGPFELSPERGRFALLYSLVEDQSFAFSPELAAFAQPDVAKIGERFVSLFAPGASFLAMPGYLLGKAVNLAVAGTILMVSVFALFNIFLIRAISMKLGASSVSATLGSIAFAFASPAFTYAVSFYQHHFTLFFLLLAIYLVIRWHNIWSYGLSLFLLSFTILIDYPNLILGFPVFFFVLSRLFDIKTKQHFKTITFKFTGLFPALFIVFPLLALMWFNLHSYGNPLQLSGTLERTIEQTRILKEADFQKSALGFFNPRHLLNGFYVHLISPDRGVVWYCPVMLFGIAGIVVAYQRRAPYFPFLVGILLTNMLLYSMWSDPWGGWAFGSRYLIPSYGVMAIFISIALTKLTHNKIFRVFFWLFLTYSIAINTLGAITSSKNPPQVEVLALEQMTKKEEKYTYERNLDFLFFRGTKSLLYQTVFYRFFSPLQYYQLLVLVIAAGSLSLVVSHYLYERKNADS
jgi:peptidoglycan/xylan/chitin deacetylase (PgdA/CDA1 family)